MKPSTYIYSIIIFLLVIVGGLSIMQELRLSKPTYATDAKFAEFNETFNVYEDTSAEITKLGSSISDASSDWGILGVLNGLIMTAWQSLKLLITNWAFMNSVFIGTTTIFGVPAWMTGLVILGITAMFVFALYSAFFQRDL